MKQCTATCTEAFIILGRAGFDHFLRKGQSKEQALKHPFAASPEAIEMELRKGQNKRDIGGAVIEELGFSLSLWSGHKEAYSLSLLVGAFSPRISNNILLKLPSSGPHSFLARESEVRAAFKSLVELLSPREAAICESSTIEWVAGRLATTTKCYERLQP